MTLRDTIHERAKQLRLSAYDIARAIYHLNHEQWIVSCDHMRDYLNGTKDMTGSKLDAVLSYLGLRVHVQSGNYGGKEHADNQDVLR